MSKECQRFNENNNEEIAVVAGPSLYFYSSEKMTDEDADILASSSHLGDIMSPRESSISLPSNYTPLQRILLTANGNVQRILSSFYNSPVAVHIKYNRKIENGINEVGVTYDRQVELKCMHRVCCNAKSIVKITDSVYIDLIENKQVGIGQLFRLKNILPEFVLKSVGASDTEFWRIYSLSSPGIECIIHEVFPQDVFEYFNQEGKPEGGTESSVILDDFHM